MVAKVIEIQVGGSVIVHTLEEACREYVKMIDKHGAYRAKINFTIKLPAGGELRYITIRDEDTETIAYGDCDGLPSFLDYAQELKLKGGV